MNLGKVNRRRFFASLLVGAPLGAVADAAWLEPKWVKVRKLNLAQGKPSHRLVHFTDLHHKGDAEYLRSVVRKINALQPDFVCMTGDIIEDAVHLPEALEILREIKAPLYGCPGNHDYWAEIDFEPVAKAFAATGGRWLMDEHTVTADGKVTLNGAAKMFEHTLHTNPATKNIMLIHYPEWAGRLGNHKFDVILAGHTHGGQCRLPFYGALVVPYYSGEYELGLYQTDAGPLYVSSGIGWFFLNIRFNCRPEIVLVEI